MAGLTKDVRRERGGVRRCRADQVRSGQVRSGCVSEGWRGPGGGGGGSPSSGCRQFPVGAVRMSGRSDHRGGGGVGIPTLTEFHSSGPVSGPAAGTGPAESRSRGGGEGGADRPGVSTGRCPTAAAGPVCRACIPQSAIADAVRSPQQLMQSAVRSPQQLTMRIAQPAPVHSPGPGTARTGKDESM